MKAANIEHLQIGSFETTRDVLIVSDPCYKLGTWCMGQVSDAKPGLWNASIGVADMGEWGRRIAYLAAFHHEAPDIKTLKLNEAKFEVGVDSGQAGIFDFDHYQDQSVIPDQSLSEFGDPWYTHCCHQTLNTEHHAGVIPFGVVASSGFGDGAYICRYYTSQSEHTPITWGVVIDFELVRMSQIMKKLCERQFGR
ncbi:DUF4241 domain-containing protein [uncultured Oscillibacter sp.]|uniref:DUF4241 domain-containing protein n=1 Tax=uncultured Oscillibacter sp. TaxID=876091 RepID=UPI00280A769F|nr:DUF4241 domain-containing protein [uncultured Oscillibacter sp.]